MTLDRFDLLIAGGGINGAGIAADAAGRGLSVLLAEMGDLGGATSSASSKLIHGGLRYLEHYEFRLVREALAERDVLLRVAPHIVHPLRFVLPHVPGMRPKLMIRAGLALYDWLAPRTRLGRSAAIDLGHDPAGAALKPALGRGFEYWDCWVDDARLVVLNALAAAERGAEVAVRTRVAAARAVDGRWHVTLASRDGAERTVEARVLVNAAGPWAGEVAQIAGAGIDGYRPPRVRLVKGSHVVVPRIAGASDAYLMQSPDRRVVFALPFEDRFTLIGTTDVPYEGDPGAVAISDDEEGYLVDLASRFFATPIAREAIVHRFAGVRPLIDDGAANPSAVTREYHLDLVTERLGAPLLNIVGGKITTYRRLAEAALALLEPLFPGMGRPWTADAPLPGGDAGSRGLEGYALDLARRAPWLCQAGVARLVRRYGTRADEMLGDARSAADLGADLGAGLSEREVRFLREKEWAREPDDVLWRRTKTALHLAPSERERAAAGVARLL